MQFKQMFVTAVCVLFLLKLKWPKSKNFYLIPSPTSGADSTENPTIAAASCSSSIGDVKTHFHGGAR